MKLGGWHTIDGRLGWGIFLVVVGVNDCLILILPIDEVKVVFPVGVHLNGPVRHRFNNYSVNRSFFNSEPPVFGVIMLPQSPSEKHIFLGFFFGMQFWGVSGLSIVSMDALVFFGRKVDWPVEIYLHFINEYAVGFILSFVGPWALRYAIRIIDVFWVVDLAVRSIFSFPIMLVGLATLHMLSFFSLFSVLFAGIITEVSLITCIFCRVLSLLLV